jgi:hypothetical protein
MNRPVKLARGRVRMDLPSSGHALLVDNHDS